MVCITHGHLISLSADAVCRFQVTAGIVGYIRCGMHGGEKLERSCVRDSLISNLNFLALLVNCKQGFAYWALERLPSVVRKVRCAAYAHSKAGPEASADVCELALLGLGRSHEW